jgi:hypothetical protein
MHGLRTGRVIVQRAEEHAVGGSHPADRRPKLWVVEADGRQPSEDISGHTITVVRGLSAGRLEIT